MRMSVAVVMSCVLLAGAALAQAPAESKTGAAQVVTVPSPSPLYEIKIMVRAGSANDPEGKEGLANLTARMLIEGSFGDPKKPVTKERLAEITRPWGEAAMPEVRVDKQTTTFSMRVPRDAFPQFVRQVLRPMFLQPLWNGKELERLRREALTSIESGLRFEQQELLGLLALDNWVLEDAAQLKNSSPGGRLGHLATGTVRGLKAVTTRDLQSFYASHYSQAVIGTSFDDANALTMVKAAIPTTAAKSSTATNREPQSRTSTGRTLLIITQPNAIATGLHLGFPTGVTRADSDYWPLFVGNVFFGTHRDDFGLLYQEIRSARGYNYGDYSYVEYLAGRPYYLFPPPTTPRLQQYFSMWIRPVGHEYAHFMLKVMTAQLERLVKQGLTPDQVAAAKIKARTLYLNYAESADRLVGYKLDDVFYGMQGRGYIENMLKAIDAVTPEQVNAAIKKHLQSANLKYIITTNPATAKQLAADVPEGRNVRSKTAEEYHFGGELSAEEKAILEQDEQWKQTPVNISRERIHIVPAEQMFETTAIPGLAASPTAKR